MSNSDSGASGQDPSPPMAAFEFLRLIGIFTEREDARQALINSGRDFSCAQQQRREGRDAFWTDLVAVLLNKSTVTVALRRAGSVDNDDELYEN